MTIKIKRATTEGIKECEGELFEHDGYQFCISEFDDYMNAIEVSTGYRSDLIDLDFASKEEAVVKLKKLVSKRQKSTMDAGIKQAIKQMKALEISYPLNERIEIV